MFIFHMRQIENAISVVTKNAEKYEWKELSDKCKFCHKQINDTLAYVKKEYKNKFNKRVNDLYKKKQLSLIKGSEEDDME